MKGVLADGQKKSTVHGDGSSGRLVALKVVVVGRNMMMVMMVMVAAVLVDNSSGYEGD